MSFLFVCFIFFSVSFIWSLNICSINHIVRLSIYDFLFLCYLFLSISFSYYFKNLSFLWLFSYLFIIFNFTLSLSFYVHFNTSLGEISYLRKKADFFGNQCTCINFIIYQGFRPIGTALEYMQFYRKCVFLSWYQKYATGILCEESYGLSVCRLCSIFSFIFFGCSSYHIKEFCYLWMFNPCYNQNCRNNFPFILDLGKCSANQKKS